MKIILQLASLCLLTVITITSCSKDEKTEVLPFIEPDKSHIALPSSGGQDKLLIRSNVKWSISNKPSWLEVSPLSGQDLTILDLSVPGNVSADSLTGSITIMAEGLSPVSISVSQMAKGQDLLVGKETLQVPSAGKVDTITFTASGPWTLDIPLKYAYWVSAVSQQGSAGTSQVIITTEANDFYLPRNALLKLSSGSPASDSVLISIFQSAPVEINSYPYQAAGGDEVEIKGNGFSTIPGENIVTINGVRAGVTYSDFSSMRVVVPYGVGDGYIEIRVNEEKAVSYLPMKYVWKGIVTVVAGGSKGLADGHGGTAKFDTPYGLGMDKEGNILVADLNNFKVRKVTPAGEVTSLPGRTARPALPGDPNCFLWPADVAVDSKGNILVTENEGHLVSKIATDGTVSILAGKDGVYGAENGTAAGATFHGPNGIFIDASDNVYIADSRNNCIRKITREGYVSTIAGRVQGGYADGTGQQAIFSSPRGVTMDHSGNLYITDNYNDYLRILSPYNMVTTFLTDQSNKYRFSRPTDIATDSRGYVFFVDSDEYIHWIDKSGKICTMRTYLEAGTNNPFEFGYLSGIVVNRLGEIFVSDQVNNRICKVVIQ